MEVPSYNHLWAVAYNFGANSGMTIHRVAVFAADYAQTFEGKPRDEIWPPDAFVNVSELLDYHYHG